jgi:hypothetical protein
MYLCPIVGFRNFIFDEFIGKLKSKEIVGVENKRVGFKNGYFGV